MRLRPPLGNFSCYLNANLVAANFLYAEAQYSIQLALKRTKYNKNIVCDNCNNISQRIKSFNRKEFVEDGEGVVCCPVWVPGVRWRTIIASWRWSKIDKRSLVKKMNKAVSFNIPTNTGIFFCQNSDKTNSSYTYFQRKKLRLFKISILPLTFYNIIIFSPKFCICTKSFWQKSFPTAHNLGTHCLPPFMAPQRWRTRARCAYSEDEINVVRVADYVRCRCVAALDETLDERWRTADGEAQSDKKIGQQVDATVGNAITAGQTAHDEARQKYDRSEISDTGWGLSPPKQQHLKNGQWLKRLTV